VISRKLFGPPGTGKTTKLLGYVKTFLKLGTPIDKIGYFAFTTKAANEAIDRMLDYHTAFQRKDLKYFRTLHSLAFTRLGLKKSEVMQDEHYEDIGRKLGIEMTVYSNGQETTGFVDSNSEYFNLINAARIKESSIEDEYNTDMYSQDMDKRLLKIISDEVKNYKDSFKLVDFTDMIERFNVSELCPKFDVAFIDEAQDLSPIQWKMVDIIKKNTKYVILAGDDDQAIYGWAGADVKKFQQDRRIAKTWKAREEEGKIQYIMDLDGLPLHDGEWLILARYNDRLNKLMPTLKDMGIYYQYKGRKSYKSSLFRSILNYTRWQKGELLSLSEVKDILECTGMNLKPTEEKMYDLTELTYDKSVNWFDVFVVDYEECLYIREMLSYGEKLSKDARVKLSTIHAAKGGEAENVLLILDNTKTIRESAEKNEDKADEENRVWYVGVTRTKQNLYVMSARKEDRGYDIESLG